MPTFPYDVNAAFVWRGGVVPGFGRGRWGLEVGDGRKFVPLDRFLAEVKVFESERDAAQKVVLTQRLCTEHAQLKFPQAQGFLAVATVHQLRREMREK